MNYFSYKARTTKMAAEIARLQQQLRDLQPNHLKLAAIGGEQEAGFEQSFASLAYAYMQDKAPRLLDYLVGFQMLDRNDDNTKAAGVFGFQLGKQWIYAPVFFLNGDLKGHELLYLKDQDSFVPMKENWINYLLSRKPHVLGEGDAQTPQQMGVRQPDLRQLSIPPLRGKYAEAYYPIMGAARTQPTKLMKKFAGLDEALSLDKLLAQDVDLIKTAMQWANDYPFLREAFNRFYGKDLFRDSLLSLRKSALAGDYLGDDSLETRTTCILSAKQAAAEDKVKIHLDPDKVITDNTDLSEEESERLLRDGHLVQDFRTGDEVTKVYNTQVPLALTNPDDSGLYDILVKPGTFSRCLVIANPHTNTGRKNMLTLIRLDGEKNWLNADRAAVWYRSAETAEDYRKWRDDNGGDSLSRKGVYVAIGPDGSASAPFRVRTDLGDGRYEVAFADSTSYKHDRPGYLPRQDDGSNYDNYNDGGSYKCCGPSSSSGDAIQINTREGTSFQSVNGTLYVPKEAKFLTIKKPPEPKSQGSDGGSSYDDDYVSSYLDNSGDSEADAIQPGNLADIQMQIIQKTAELKIWTDHHEVVINRNRMSKRAALFCLIRQHGCREETALEMLKEASRLGGVRYRVKYSESLQPGPDTPPMPQQDYGYDPYTGVPTVEPWEWRQGIPDMSAANTDYSVYSNNQPPQPDPSSMQVAQQASQSGQKEVFDTAMVSSLLKTVRQDSLVDKYLGDLTKALDRLGRILFLFYWRNDEFLDRYGKADAPELEDTVRNSFESLGDLILFLKEKSVDTSAVQMGGEPEIQQVARM